jgi:hypothetical protein
MFCAYVDVQKRNNDNRKKILEILVLAPILYGMDFKKVII